MLQHAQYRERQPTSAPSIDNHENRVAWLEVVRDGLTRHKIFIATVVAVSLALAVAYLLIAPPVYQARAELVLDSRTNQDPVQQSAPSADLELAFMESQVEILKSEAVLKQVATETGYEAPRGLLGRLLGGATGWLASSPVSGAYESLLGWTSSPSKPASTATSAQDLAMHKRVAAMELRLNVRRLGSSNVVSIQFADSRPDMAAKVTNAVIDVYNARQQELQKTLLLEHKSWLEDRVRQLGESSAAEEQKIARFKQQNDVLSLALDSAVERQVAEVSTQLTLARAQSAEAKARLDRLVGAEAGGAESITGDVLKNEVLTRLRLQFLDVRKRLEEADARYGVGNPASVDLGAEKAALERALADERQRVERSYRSEYEVAAVRERSLADSLAAAARQAGEGAGKRASLKEMEAFAQNFRAMSEGFARRLSETGPRLQTAPEARVITRASAPYEKSDPNVAFTLLGALAGGLLIGGGVATAREYRKDVFHDLPKLSRWTGADYVVGLPRLPAKDIRSLPGEDRGSGPLQAPDRAGRYAITHPASRFAQQIRLLADRLDPASQVRAPVVVGILSARSGEGKSVVAANLAHVSAAIGLRTALIRLDRPETPDHAQKSAAGRRRAPKVEHASGAVDVDPDSGLEYASLAPEAYSRTAGAYIPAKLHEVIADRYRTHDLVVLDLPAINEHSDAAALAGLIDRIVLVVAADETSGADVETALKTSTRINDNLAAVVLNKRGDR